LALKINWHFIKYFSWCTSSGGWLSKMQSLVHFTWRT